MKTLFFSSNNSFEIQATTEAVSVSVGTFIRERNFCLIITKRNELRIHFEDKRTELNSQLETRMIKLSDKRKLKRLRK